MDIQHDEAGHRFWAATAHGEAVVSYEPVGDDALDLIHTWVPHADREDGLGARLVLHVLDHARRHGLRIVPTCPFVGRVMLRHPEYADLRLRRS